MLLFSVMASAIKGIVSKNKIRYKEDGFDLDLSYISRNIIAMGFPAETLERFYRNHIDDVVKFFDFKHFGRYKIYNLCSESCRRYDITKFHGPVDVEYSFQDHNPPPFAILKPFCESVSKWLELDPANVAGIHCKAGKGRTGVMICAYLVHTGGCELGKGQFQTIHGADHALAYYGRNRTHDSKGVTIPSQKRYVYYYEELVKRQLKYSLVSLKLTSIILSPVPTFNGGSYTLTCDIYDVLKVKIHSFDIEVKKGCKSVIHPLNEELCLTGDIKFEFNLKKMKKEKVFQLCVNTFFVGLGTDIQTVVVTEELCPKCDRRMLNVISSLVAARAGAKCAPNPNNPQRDPSVIKDFSFLDLLYPSRNEPFQYCDCTIPYNPASGYLHANSTASHALNGNGTNLSPLLPPPSSLPSTSNSVAESKSSPISSSSSSASSSSSILSLNHKMSNHDLQLGESFATDFHVVLPKDKIDKAYKDKSSKIFPSDFKVILNFTTVGLDATSKLRANRARYDSSSETDNSEEDEEASDLENKPTDRNCETFPATFAVDGKNGESTHL